MLNYFNLNTATSILQSISNAFHGGLLEFKKVEKDNKEDDLSLELSRKAYRAIKHVYDAEGQPDIEMVAPSISVDLHDDIMNDIALFCGNGSNVVNAGYTHDVSKFDIADVGVVEVFTLMVNCDTDKGDTVNLFFETINIVYPDGKRIFYGFNHTYHNEKGELCADTFIDRRVYDALSKEFPGNAVWRTTGRYFYRYVVGCGVQVLKVQKIDRWESLIRDLVVSKVGLNLVVSYFRFGKSKIDSLLSKV